MRGKYWRWITWTALFGVLLTGCGSMKVGSHRDDTVSLNDYRTYAWIAEDSFIVGENDPMQISPLLKRKIVTEIDDTLSRKGYVTAGSRGDADFIVAYTVGTRERIDATSYPPAYGGPWAWHVYGRYYYESQNSHRTYTEGTLGIDIFDGASRQPVWHGWASKSIYSSDRQNPDPLVEKAVSQVLAQFPNVSE